MDEKILRQQGYVPLAEFDDRSRRSNDAHSPSYKALKKAIDKGDKTIPSAQIPATKYGRFWVHKSSAERFLSEAEAAISEAVHRSESAGDATSSVACREHGERRDVSPAQLEAAVVALCEINNGISLVLATLERLTSAVESITKQPDYADRLRREIVATCDNANGFHN